MTLLFLIALASLGGFLATWFAWGIAHGGRGNPILSMLVAFGIALLWGRGMERLERAFMANRDDVVNRKLRLWGAAIGAIETVLVRLRMAVERGDRDEAERMIALAEPLELAPFAKSLAASMAARMSGDRDRALAALTRGLDVTTGMDRAELLAERSLVTLEGSTLVPLTQEEMDAVVADMNAVGNHANKGAASRERTIYLDLLLADARALLYLAQGRAPEALRIIDTAIRKAGDPMSLRCRGLMTRLRIERILAIDGVQGRDAALALLSEMRSVAKRPLWVLRMNEIGQWFTVDTLAKAAAKTTGSTGSGGGGSQAPEIADESRVSEGLRFSDTDDSEIAVPWNPTI